MRYQEQERVQATRTITEGGVGFPGDPKAKFAKTDDGHIDRNYIHAVEGDFGTVEYVQHDKDVQTPTVRFDRTGTATIVSDDEIQKAAEA